jgi:hypothetical protein
LHADIHRQFSKIQERLPALDAHDLEVLAARLNDAWLEVGGYSEDFRARSIDGRDPVPPSVALMDLVYK